MGYAKRLLEKEWEQGFRSTGKTACAKCLGNPHLVNLVTPKRGDECSYCARESPVASVDEVIKYFLEAISAEYEDGSNAPWDSEEGDYFIDTYLIRDILGRHFSGDLFSAQDLEEDLVGSLEGRMWVQKDWQILNRSQGLSLSWKEFCDAVKHRTRYLFFEPEKNSDDQDSEYVGPAGMLSELESLIQRYGLTKTVPAGSHLFRVRCGNVAYTSPRDLGPPPSDKASQSRMSAAGISCMYLADEIETAVEETREHGIRLASCGTFEILTDLLLVDFTTPPPKPSILDKGTTHERGEVDFLLGMIIDVSKSIEKDNRIHTEYVPTQVVAEYIRHRLHVNGQRVDGIVYSSSKGSGNNFVIFVDDRYIEGSGAFLSKDAKFRLVKFEQRSIPARKN